MYFTPKQILLIVLRSYLPLTNYALKALYTYLMSLTLLSEEFKIKSRAKNLAKILTATFTSSTI